MINNDILTVLSQRRLMADNTGKTIFWNNLHGVHLADDNNRPAKQVFLSPFNCFVLRLCQEPIAVADIIASVTKHFTDISDWDAVWSIREMENEGLLKVSMDYDT